MAILEESVKTPEPLTSEDVLEEVQRLHLRTPSEAVEVIRADRDVR